MAKKISKAKNKIKKTINKIKSKTKAIIKKSSPKITKKTAPKKGFGKKDLEYFKNIILEKRKEILEELESLKSTMMDVTTGQYEIENSIYSQHMEQGTDAMEREKTFLFASREGKFLNYLEDALRRIENGTYGFCTSCGKLMEKERLEAVPHAHECMACKTKKNGK